MYCILHGFSDSHTFDLLVKQILFRLVFCLFKNLIISALINRYMWLTILQSDLKLIIILTEMPLKRQVFNNNISNNCRSTACLSKIWTFRWNLCKAQIFLLISFQSFLMTAQNELTFIEFLVSEVDQKYD